MGIGIRKATLDDAKILFNWANDSETRQNSLNSEIIDWEDHIQWLKGKIDDPKYSIYILFTEIKPIGVVRFDYNESAVVSISVAPEERRKGIGSKILLIACQYFWESNTESIIAYIKKGNIASQRIFEKSGFNFLKESRYKNITCITLIAHNNVNK
jgi:RimJ/RimL family protein N-acetyltransferase